MKNKFLLASITILSASLLAACTSDTEKAREAYINDYNTYLSNGDQYNAIQSLQKAEQTIPFVGDENYSQYDEILDTQIVNYYYNQEKLAKNAVEQKNYDEALTYINNMETLMNTITYDYSPETANFANLKSSTNTLKIENDFYNEFYKTFSTAIIANQESIKKYNSILDQINYNQISEADAMQSKKAIINDVKETLNTIETIETTKFSRAYSDLYLAHYNQINDFTFNLSMFLTNIDTTLETYTEKASSLNGFKKNLLQIEQNYLNFGISNDFKIFENK